MDPPPPPPGGSPPHTLQAQAFCHSLADDMLKLHVPYISERILQHVKAPPPPPPPTPTPGVKSTVWEAKHSSVAR